MAANMPAGVNLLAWDWRNEAKPPLPWLESLSLAFWRTPAQGRGLGESLASQLGASYDQPIHFIGHSLGTLVNATAANYLHGLSGIGFDSKRTHVTLLDNAQAASIAGALYVNQYVVAGFESFVDSATAPPLLLSPLPDEFSWADNYISLVGLQKTRAVNTILIQAPQRVTPVFDVIEQHGYAHRWYAATVASPQASDLGNQFSFERMRLSETLFSSSPYPPGTAFSQIPGGSELQVKRLNSEREIATALLSVRPGVHLTRLVLQQAVEVVAGAVQTSGQVLVEVGQALIPSPPTGTPVFTGTAGSTPAYYTDSRIEETPTWSLQVSLRSGTAMPFSSSSRLESGAPTRGAPVFNRLLAEGASKQSSTSLKVDRTTVAAAEQAPGVWIPVAVPANATMFSFDFTLSGEPGDDVLSASIGGTNVFALEAKFMPTNATLNSGPIDVSRWAGQTVEFFFGLSGARSSDADVTVSGMRFYQVEQPTLKIVFADDRLIVSWPATMTGYVLESAERLAVPGGWMPVSPGPELSGRNHVVRITPRSSEQYFRLRRR